MKTPLDYDYLDREEVEKLQAKLRLLAADFSVPRSFKSSPIELSLRRAADLMLEAAIQMEEFLPLKASENPTIEFQESARLGHIPEKAHIPVGGTTGDVFPVFDPLGNPKQIKYRKHEFPHYDPLAVNFLRDMVERIFRYLAGDLEAFHEPKGSRSDVVGKTTSNHDQLYYHKRHSRRS